MDITIAPDETVWFIIARIGVVHVTEDDLWISIPFITESQPSALAISPDGDIWLGETWGDVLYYFNGTNWYRYTNMPFDVVDDILITSDDVWVATDVGVYRKSP